MGTDYCTRQARATLSQREKDVSKKGLGKELRKAQNAKKPRILLRPKATMLRNATQVKRLRTAQRRTGNVHCHFSVL